MEKFKPSVYQQRIFDFIANGSGSAIVEAVAGSGKTSTIVQGLNLIPNNKRTLFLAFNKSIALELQKRIPGHVKAQTLNGMGHGAWMRYRQGSQVKLNANKTRDIIRNKSIKIIQ